MERILFLGLTVIAAGSYQDASAEKPTMMPRGDQLVIQKGMELKIECYSKKAAVQFSFPEYSFMSPRSSYEIRTADNGASTFLRKNAISYDTGWYACATEAVQIENNFKNLNHTHEDIAWIYIYVNSSTPFADRYYSFPKPITVLSGWPAIVPCRPTSPFSDVQLWQNSRIVLLDDEKIRFDPRIGFIIEQFIFEDLVMQFHCKLDNVTDNYDLYYSKAKGQKPKMSPNTEELRIHEGDELRIECYGESGIQFFFPHTGSVTHSYGQSVPSDFELVYKNGSSSAFIRRSTVIADAGWYGCSEKGINSKIQFRNYIDYTRTEINWIYVYVQWTEMGLVKEDELPGTSEVQYVDGSDIKIPCRPTSSFADVLISCDDGVVEEKRFDSKYGYIVKRELNNSIGCCFCYLLQSPDYRIKKCSLKIPAQQIELLDSPRLLLLSGENLRLLYAEVTMYGDDASKVGKSEWIVPSTASKNRIKPSVSLSPYQYYGLLNWHCFYLLELKNATEKDSGEYDIAPKTTSTSTSDLGSINSFEVLIVDRKSWEYKKLRLHEDGYEIMRQQNESLRLMVDLRSFSSGIIRWVDPSGLSIDRKGTFDSEIRMFHITRGLRSMLVIQNLLISNGGIYQLRINTSVGVMAVNVTLDVQAPPTIPIINGSQPYYVVPDQYFHMSCCSIGSPKPNITWTFLKQPNYPTNRNSTLVYPTIHQYVTHDRITGCSELTMNTDTVGILTCTACNSFNCSSFAKTVILSDSDRSFRIIRPEKQLFLGDDATLICAASIWVFHEIKWVMDFNECYEDDKNNTFHFEDHSSGAVRQNVLYMNNVTKCHNRWYTCYVRDSLLRYSSVSDMLSLSVPKRPYFTRSSLNGSKIILDAESDHGKIKILTCRPDGDPLPNVTWFKNDLQVEESQEHHLLSKTYQLVVVLDLRDAKNRRYTCKAKNRFGEIEDYIDYITEVPPVASIINGKHPYYATPDEFFPISCCAIGSPRSNIAWTFLRQPKYPSDTDSSLAFPSMHIYVTHNRTAGCSDLIMNTSTVGILTCKACNPINCSVTTRRIFLSENVGRFGIIGPKVELFFGDNVTLKCAGSIYAFKKLWWDTNFDECYENGGMKNLGGSGTFYTKNDRTQFTIQSILHIKNVSKCHNRSYSCLGITMTGSNEVLSYNLRLSIPEKVHFTSTSLNESKITLDAESDQGKIQRLTCCADGVPPPHVTWFKDGSRIEESQEHHFLPETCELIVVPDLGDGYNRRYTCQAENRLEKIRDHVDFIVKGGKAKHDKILSMSIIPILLLIGLVAWFVLRKRRKEKARRKFKEAILARFDEGALNYVQLNVNMASQAEILPFDKQWEYPRKLLKFEKILGSGAFGIVRRAEAKSICSGQKVTTVAVKMVRATHRLHYMTALIRELKVLVHLGSHLNIVNLLGACTKNISYGELLVIVEFCRFGNLRDYLFHRRADFIDQIDPVTNQIIDQDLGTNVANVECNQKHITDDDDDSETGNICSSTGAKKTGIINDKLLVDGLVQPSLRSQYRNDDPDLIMESISTKDLLCWAWQVTRGMNYLGFRKVVHGDLAARNVLLADNNIIKICDFGLAEILYKNEDYKKLIGDLLPLQWMAVESIRDRVFSTKSDVWSFGILLWEFFTLAETPYYGVHPRHLYQKLSSGYRMSRPKYAPEKIYNMMSDCWKANPALRPSFATLESEIGKQLDNGIHTYYADMSPMYTELSNETADTEKIDYLTMDPSQVKKVSFSIPQVKIESVDIPLDEFCDSAGPSTRRNDVPLELHTSDTHLQFSK